MRYPCGLQAMLSSVQERGKAGVNLQTGERKMADTISVIVTQNEY
jgi:hypothetical protein